MVLGICCPIHDLITGQSGGGEAVEGLALIGGLGGERCTEGGEQKECKRISVSKDERGDGSRNWKGEGNPCGWIREVDFYGYD